VALSNTSSDCHVMFVSGLGVQLNSGTVSYTVGRLPLGGGGITNWRKLHNVASLFVCLM
jgi:hypothetical protein